MVDQVADLTKKSFRNYTGPDDRFKQKNIIFGYNGRGKTSLALGIKDEYLKDNSTTEDKLRFFNKDYVEDNLKLQDPTTGARSKNKIKGVIARFSARDVKSAEKIEELTSKLVEVSPIRAEIDELKADTRKAIDAIHDRRKGTANIAKKNKEFEISKVIELYNQDLIHAKKIEADETRLSKIEGDNVIGEKIELLKTVEFQDFAKITAQDIADTQDIFDKTFGNVSIPSSEIVDWLNKGLEIHEEGDDCKFCGGKLALHEITKNVEEYNSNEKQQATKYLQALDDKMAELQNTIKANLERRAYIKSSMDADVNIDNSFSYIEEAAVGIASARSVIRAKVKNIDSKPNFINFIGDLQKFNDAIKVLVDTKNNQLTKLESQNNSKDMLVKGAIGLEILNDTNIKDKLADIKARTERLNSAIVANTKFEGEIQRLKQAESATSDFAEYISGILANLAIHLKLSVSEDGRNYIIQHTQTGADITIADISEGERNLLALLFFYYELFNDSAQQDYKGGIELIIVDDPVSSMDDINKMYILELMKQILALDPPQVFVMTHSWEDFTNLCYGLYDKKDTQNAFFEIKKDGFSNSLVVKTKSNIPPYHHNFLDVYEFSQKPDTTNLDDCDVYHLPNIMRQVLEGFLGFKTHKNSPTKNNQTEIGRVLFNKEWTAITEAEKTELGQLLLVTNVNSHSSSRSPDEILKSAKFLMKRIRVADERHFNTNKEPINV